MQWLYLVMGDVIWQAVKADSNILNHAWGLSNQNLGRLMVELNAARMISLPWYW